MNNLIAEYRINSEWNLEELEIEETEIESYYIKWNKLFIIFKDGMEEEFEPTIDGTDFDYKRPTTIFED